MGHPRRIIEERLGYAEKGIDQSLSREANEKLYKQILLYRDWAVLNSSISQEDLLILNEPGVKYGKKTNVKVVDAEQLMVHDMLQIKIMQREILRNQAKILAAQQKKDVKIVLKEINESLRAESSEEFDGL